MKYNEVKRKLRQLGCQELKLSLGTLEIERNTFEDA